MKKIIAVKARANTGKTTAIVKVAERLKKRKDAEVIVWEEFKGREVFFVANVSGVKIGLCSEGDVGDLLTGHLTRLIVKMESVLIVCACRTRGATANAVQENGQKNGYDIEYLENDGDSYIDADKLFNMVTNAIALIKKANGQ